MPVGVDTFIPFPGGGGGVVADARVLLWDLATSWATVYAQILSHSGAAIVLVEPDAVPRVMTAGVADLDDVSFLGLPVSPDVSVLVDMDDGVVLGPGGGLRSKNVLWRSLCVATRIVGSGPPCSFDFDGGGLIGWTDPAATNPIRLDPGGCKIRLTNAAVLSGAGMPPGNPLVVVSGGGSLDIQALAGSAIGDHTLGGGIFAAATVSSDASVTISPTFFSGFIGVTSSLLDAAARVTYDDTLSPPLLATSNVQGAIDALKARTLDDVLGVGNVAATHDILLDPAHVIDTNVAGVMQVCTVNATALGIGSPSGGLSAFQVLINQGGASFLSNAGLQFSSTTSNRASCRFNQFGANAGVPGIVGFKSRGANVGDLSSCVAGDVLFRATAIGVPTDNVSVPLAGWLGIQVPTGGVGANYLATDFEVRLTPLAGPINGHKQAFLVDSEGVLHGKESANCFAGVATLDGAGNATIANTRVSATTKFTLTVQEGTGVVPAGTVYQASRVVGTSFTVSSTGGAADAGLQVYYQLWEPCTP